MLLGLLAAAVAVASASAIVPGIPTIYVEYSPNCTFALSVDGQTVGTGRAPKLMFMISSTGMDLGRSLSAVTDDYAAHRLEREQQVADALAAGDTTASEIVARLYVGLIDELVPRAKQSVHAHLRKLAADSRAIAKDLDDPEAEWSKQSA